MNSYAHAADVPFAAYVGRVADFERKISEYNSEQVARGFLERQPTAVSSATPPVYTVRSGQALALLFKFTHRDSNDNLRPQNPEFFGCDKIIRRIDGKVVQLKDMTGFTWENELLSSDDPDIRRRGMLGKFEPPLPGNEFSAGHCRLCRGRGLLGRRQPDRRQDPGVPTTRRHSSCCGWMRRTSRPAKPGTRRTRD